MVGDQRLYSPSRDGIGVTREGRLTDVRMNVSDLQEFEDAEDVAAYRAAKALDDGERVSLEELLRDLNP